MTVTRFISSSTLKARTNSVTHISNIFITRLQSICSSILATTFRRNLQATTQKFIPIHFTKNWQVILGPQILRRQISPEHHYNPTLQSNRVSFCSISLNGNIRRHSIKVLSETLNSTKNGIFYFKQYTCGLSVFCLLLNSKPRNIQPLT